MSSKPFVDWKELREALIFLKVWAQQRCSVYAYDCLNGLLLSIILLYLGTEYGQNRVKSPMTTMQIFHVTLDFIDMGYWVVLSACWRKQHFKRGARKVGSIC